MIPYLRFIVFLLIVGGIASCTQEAQQQISSSLNVLPIAYGDQNQLTIIADGDLWEGDVGDTVDFYYSAPYLLLPQPEPILDLRHFTPRDLVVDPLRKELRAYLFVDNLSDENAEGTRLVKKIIGDAQFEKARMDPKYNLVQLKDKWAKDQLIIFQFGRNQRELIDNLKKNQPLILQKIREHDRPKLEATVYLDNRNEELEREVYENFGIRMKIPRGYYKAIGDDNLYWFRHEQEKISNNIFISRLPYTDVSQISEENIKAVRDSLGKFVSTRADNTYMRINDIDLPVFTKVTRVDNKYALEARGIWEIANDYMGGPFVSYLVHNPKGDELIFIDGFIHAPGEDKRNFMQYLEHILASVQLP